MRHRNHHVRVGATADICLSRTPRWFCLAFEYSGAAFAWESKAGLSGPAVVEVAAGVEAVEVMAVICVATLRRPLRI